MNKRLRIGIVVGVLCAAMLAYGTGSGRVVIGFVIRSCLQQLKLLF